MAITIPLFQFLLGGGEGVIFIWLMLLSFFFQVSFFYNLTTARQKGIHGKDHQAKVNYWGISLSISQIPTFIRKYLAWKECWRAFCYFFVFYFHLKKK